MDFIHILERPAKNGVTEIFPEFRVGRSSDLMVRGKSFYAIWDDERGLWSTDEYDVQRLVDAKIRDSRDHASPRTEGAVQAKFLANFSNGGWTKFQSYIKSLADNGAQLDQKVIFANTPTRKEDFASKRLPYSLSEDDPKAYHELMGTLYSDEERAKLEWAVGAVLAGDAKDIQKFIVLYGEAGAGKSTFLNIVQRLFEGYYVTFEAKSLTSNNNQFSTEVFKTNPLVAIQHDGDLSKIEDNTRLNSIVSHEEMYINEKYKPGYTSRVNAFLFMGTNRPVKITDAKSGIIRRLIDVKPSGDRVSPKRYHMLVHQINFELGAIANHCLNVYRAMGKDYYSSYIPLEMILQTDVFYNYVEQCYPIFREQDGVSLRQAYDLYKAYCAEAHIDYVIPRHRFRDELRNYFHEFHDRAWVDNENVRSYYKGFIHDKFHRPEVPEKPYSLVLDKTESILDDILAGCPAQYANEKEWPSRRWADVTTTMSDIDSSELHYVKPPLNHIVIDFDLKDAHGNKSPQRNLEAACQFPPTYAEFSKGGGGIHLHYIYDGDTKSLSRVYDEGIEIKVFSGGAALRRRLTTCNDVPIAHIKEGLPTEEVKVIDFKGAMTEKGLRNLILRNLNKEIHPSTKPSVDFIKKILDDAYSSDLHYDVSDLKQRVLQFAMGSSNQAALCVKMVGEMHFRSEEPSQAKHSDDERIVIFDVEVFPNKFILVWKYLGGDNCVVMVDPSPREMGDFLRMKLVGFNNRGYDNHICYARYMGYTNAELFKLSKSIVHGKTFQGFREAYSASYADIHDFASKKQSLKKWEVELGIKHMELDWPWDQDLPEDMLPKAIEYCENDVRATEALFLARKGDFDARLILADLSGLTPNDPTRNHIARILFGKDKNAKEQFVYTDLSKQFPGYVYEGGRSTYRGIETGEGGLVYAEPGVYTDVAVLDVASMHPTSIEQLNLFGPYTKKYSEIREARLAIKHKDWEKLKGISGGAYSKHIQSEAEADSLSYALKIVLNSVYGLTSARFENPFLDHRNKDNIVAKRGALFMVDLMYAVQERGFTVAHIKTDSIKIPNATPEIIKFVMDFGKQYGYEFEHETTYSRMALVNDAVLIGQDERGKWHATGAQFAHPVVFKTLFSHEPVDIHDLKETRSVTTALYLDFNEHLPDGEHARRFVGKTGVFLPVLPGVGGGELVREKDGAYSAATGSKGYRWMEFDQVISMGLEDSVDRSYYNHLVTAARQKIESVGDPDIILEG